MTNDKWTVIKELTDILEKCEIEAFDLNAEEQKLTLSYKEDFDKYFPNFPNVQPVVERDSGRKILPYGWDHWAFFNYKGWEILGNIMKHKPK